MILLLGGGGLIRGIPQQEFALKVQEGLCEREGGGGVFLGHYILES